MSIVVPVFSPQRDRELLVIGTAVTWATTFKSGADSAFRRRTEDMLLDAVEQWRKGGMVELDSDPAVVARRAANTKAVATKKPKKKRRTR